LKGGRERPAWKGGSTPSPIGEGKSPQVRREGGGVPCYCVKKVRTVDERETLNWRWRGSLPYHQRMPKDEERLDPLKGEASLLIASG